MGAQVGAVAVVNMPVVVVVGWVPHQVLAQSKEMQAVIQTLVAIAEVVEVVQDT